MKFKIVFIFITIIAFLGSCKSYKSVLEKEKENELIKNSIQADYEIENIYKINKKSTLELRLEEGKKYKFQYFSKKYHSPIMNLFNFQSEIIATSKINYGDSSYFSKTIIFECKNTGIYNLKLEGKRFPNSLLLVVASQNLTREIEEYTFIKTFKILHRRKWTYPEIPIHKCVFSKGTTYKFIFEKGIKNAKLYKSNSRKAIIEFYPHSNDNEIVFQCRETNIYHLKAISFIEDKPATISLYSNRSDSTKSN